MAERIKAYLSHRREDGGLSDFAQFLLDQAPEDIDLKVDSRDAELSRPIDEFIGELKTSSSVVFLLNAGFFRSPWCLGELHTFLERRNASFHGFFIASDGWMREPDVRAFFARQGQALISHLTDHWDGVARQAETDEVRLEARRFNEDLPEMFRILRRFEHPRRRDSP